MIFENINYKHINNNKKNLIVFLHGWGCNMKSFSFFERFFLFDYDVLNIDLYGFGMSLLPEGEFGIYEYAKNIFMLIKMLNYEKITIVAHSFGFRISIILSSCFDLNIVKMIVTGGAGLKPRFNLITKSKIFFYKLIKKIKLNCVLGSLDYKNSNERLRKVFLKVVNQHLDFLLPKIKCFMMMFWGDKDLSTPLYMAKRILKKVEFCELKIVRGSHFAFMENKLLFVDESLRFVKCCNK